MTPIDTAAIREDAERRYRSIGKAWEYLAKHADHLDGEVANANDAQRDHVLRLADGIEARDAELVALRRNYDELMERYGTLSQRMEKLAGR